MDVHIGHIRRGWMQYLMALWRWDVISKDKPKWPNKVIGVIAHITTIEDIIMVLDGFLGVVRIVCSTSILLFSRYRLRLKRVTIRQDYLEGAMVVKKHSDLLRIIAFQNVSSPIICTIDVSCLLMHAACLDSITK